MTSTKTGAPLDLELLFHQLPGLYLILDPALTIIEVSNSYLKATLTKRENLINYYIFDVFPDNPAASEANAASNLRASLQQVLQQKRTQKMAIQRYDIPRPAEQGGGFEKRYWKVRNKPVKNAANEIQYIIHQVKDITFYYQEKQVYQLNEELLHVAMQMINDVIWDWNLPDNKIIWSDGFNTRFGYQKEDVEPTVYSKYSRIHPEDVERIEHSIQTVIQHGLEVWSDVYRFKRKDGSFAEILDRGFVLRDSQQKPYRMIGAMIDISQTKQAEEDARQSAFRFNSLMESLPLMTWTALPTGKVNYYNQRWSEYLGISQKELLEIGWEHYIHPEDKTLTQTKWQHAVTTGTPLEVENKWRSVSSAEYRWFLVRAVPIRDENDEIILWIGSHTDIDVHKRFQEELQIRDEKLQRMLQQAPAHFCLVKGPDQIIDFATPGIQQLFGNRECIGLPIGTAWPEIEEQGLTRLMKQVYSSGEPLVFQETKVMVDRLNKGQLQEGYFSFTYQPFRDSQNRIEGVLILAVEVTDQVIAKRQAEILTKQLRAEKERFEFLAETIPQFIWTTDQQGYHDYFNQRWINYTGYDVEASRGTEMWRNLLHPDDRERSQTRWEHSLRTGEFYEVEYRFKSKEGNYRWFLGQATPMHDVNGNITKWFGTCTDIEEKKRSEEELLTINQELRKTNEDLDSFVYTASHDLKLPIISMSRIFSELTRSAQFTAPDAEILITMFHKSLDQLHTTIRDLTDIVQVQKNLDQHQEITLFTDVIQEVQLSIQDIIKESDAQIIAHFEAAPTIYFSRVNLKSIIYNLLSNAIKYRSPHRKPVINIKTDKENEFIVLTVQDNGLGINLERHKGKLFQMFKRFHNHVGGSGIGLYIINRIVQNNGGHIELTSEVDAGTTFKVYLKQQERTRST
ncbi:PAS domain-containing sensor histidine kinase [Adhaeribacter radiodurans]|uniref:histidine kinase n=1 Tax=Adhaeribacter radiodurans TaxID=2745197 RepID=A0A7L7LD10_9BACT|nr:PAS domain-containing sensor histidine kinase [Adhaeribacter radiodurans]QMU30701.1 PAS domain-containing protein [Adhaeribacter radiodurans]